MTHLEELTAELNALRADEDLTTAQWAEALIAKGWGKVVTQVVAPKSGQPVEVLYRGDWVPGQILSVGPGGLLDIAHERGSISAYAKGTLVRARK